MLWVGELFPPITTLIATVVPGGRLGLAILGALFAGYLLQKVREGMVQRQFPRSTGAILLIALGANPLFAYTALENLPSFLGLGLFGLGLLDMVRFVAWGNTQSGFRAGIMFLLAALAAPGGVLYVVAAAITAPFLTLGRPQNAAGNTFIMMVLLGIALIPRSRTRTSTALINALALGLVAVGWAAAIDRPVVHDWMALVADAASRLYG